MIVIRLVDIRTNKLPVRARDTSKERVDAAGPNSNIDAGDASGWIVPLTIVLAGGVYELLYPSNIAPSRNKLVKVSKTRNEDISVLLETLKTAIKKASVQSR
jgi:hypothetical protein